MTTGTTYTREFCAGIALAVLALGVWSVYRIMVRRFW